MAAPILVTPGQAVSPPDWNALLLQHGDLQPNGQPQAVPITDPQVKALVVSNPALAAHFQQHPPYRYYMADGTSVIAFGMEDGEHVQIIDYKPSPKFTQTQKQEEKPPSASARRTRTDTEGTQRPDGTWDNEQPRAVTRDIDTGEIIDSKPLTGQALQDWREAQGRVKPTEADLVGKPTGNTRQRTEGNSTVKET